MALFSDIHANLPALLSCLKSIEEQKADAIYCLGDLVGYDMAAESLQCPYKIGASASY
ncbi:MAG: metallophosphoesterase family protein [Ferruginibacter sp.]